MDTWLAYAGVVGAGIILFVVLPRFIDSHTERTSKVRIAFDDGHTVHGSLAAITALACAGFASLILWIGVAHGVNPNTLVNRIWWVLLIIGFAASAFAIARELLGRWAWNAHGLTFQSRRQTQTITWPEISKIWVSGMGLLIVESSSGVRIEVSPFAIRADVLAEAIRRARPDLPVPPFRQEVGDVPF